MSIEWWFEDLCHIDAAILDTRTLPLLGGAAERRAGAGVARILIRVVTAVVLPVTHHRVDDAARVVTLEIVFAAVYLAATVRFIGSVLAIGRTVTEPCTRNAHRRPARFIPTRLIYSLDKRLIGSVYLWQVNCLSSLHLSGSREGHPASSLASSQSGMPSHLYDSWTHCLPLEHLSCCDEQDMGGQPSSSLLSKQSLSPSHTHDCGMQWPERGHVNWK